MGHIRLDERNGQRRLVFYVGNGKKNVPKRAVDLKDSEPATMEAAIAEGLSILRLNARASEKFNGS